MFMKVEKVRIEKEAVDSSLQAISWHVPDMTEEIQGSNRKYDQQSDRDSYMIPPTYNCYQHTVIPTYQHKGSISPQQPLLQDTN